MAFLEVPAFYPEDGFEEKLEMGMEIKYTVAPLCVNVNNISAYHENDEGRTIIHLNSSDVYRIDMDIDSFASALNVAMLTVEYDYSNN